MMTKQKLAQTSAGQTRGLGSRSRRHRPRRERWEEALVGRRPQPTMEDPSPDDAGQTTTIEDHGRYAAGYDGDGL